MPLHVPSLLLRISEQRRDGRVVQRERKTQKIHNHQDIQDYSSYRERELCPRRISLVISQALKNTERATRTTWSTVVVSCNLCERAGVLSCLSNRAESATTVSAGGHLGLPKESETHQRRVKVCRRANNKAEFLSANTIANNKLPSRSVDSV